MCAHSRWRSDVACSPHLHLLIFWSMCGLPLWRDRQRASTVLRARACQRAGSMPACPLHIPNTPNLPHSPHTPWKTHTHPDTKYYKKPNKINWFINLFTEVYVSSVIFCSCKSMQISPNVLNLCFLGSKINFLFSSGHIFGFVSASFTMCVFLTARINEYSNVSMCPVHA